MIKSKEDVGRVDYKKYDPDSDKETITNRHWASTDSTDDCMHTLVSY